MTTGRLGSRCPDCQQPVRAVQLPDRALLVDRRPALLGGTIHVVDLASDPAAAVERDPGPGLYRRHVCPDRTGE